MWFVMGPLSLETRPVAVSRARQMLSYYHCKEYLHKVAKVQYESSAQALEWVEATLFGSTWGKSDGSWVG